MYSRLSLNFNLRQPYPHSLTEMAQHWNIYILTKEVLKDTSSCIEWCKGHGLLLVLNAYPKCRKNMIYDETRHGIGGFRCRRGHEGKGEVYFFILHYFSSGWVRLG